MRFYSSQLVQLMQVQYESITHHFVDSFVVAQRPIIPRDYAGIGS